MKTLAFANQKGGVGKTTTAAAVGSLLAGQGVRVLLIDLDPQASLTQSLGIAARGRSMADVIGGAQRGKLTLKDIAKNLAKNLDIAPSDIELASQELGLVSRTGRENILRNALAALSGYDAALIDCPPSLGLMTINALAAADAVIVPTLPAAGDLRGVRLFMDTLKNIQEEGINPGLELLGVLFVQFDDRLLSHAQALTTTTKAGLQVIGKIPRSVKVQEATAAKQPLTVYDPTGKPAQAYNTVTRKVKTWLKNQR